MNACLYGSTYACTYVRKQVVRQHVRMYVWGHFLVEAYVKEGDGGG